MFQQTLVVLEVNWVPKYFHPEDSGNWLLAGVDCVDDAVGVSGNCGLIHSAPEALLASVNLSRRMRILPFTFALLPQPG